MKNLAVAAFLSAFALAAQAVPTGLTPKDGAVVPTHTALQKEFLNTMPRAARVAKFADKLYRAQLADGKWYPLPTELSWKAAGECEVKVARKADGKVVFAAKTADGKASVDNLEIACDYVWTVKDADGEASSAFRTEDEAPRLIRVAHVPNVRDLGGRVGLGGRRVKQNLVFRSAGLNDNAGTRPMTREEAVEADPSGALIAAGDQIGEYRASLEKLAKDRAGCTFPKCEYPKSWKVADVAKQMTFKEAALMAIGGKLPVGERTIAIDGSGSANFARSGVSVWIALTGEIVAEADGYAAFGASGDWFWSMEVNGQLVRNLLGGNHDPADTASHRILVPVKRGPNTVKVLLGAGSGGHSFCLRELPAANRGKLLDREIAELKKMPASLLGESKMPVPGKTRIHGDNRDYLLKTLGIKSDIDLRSDRECFGMEGSPLGPTVTWFHYSSSAYKGMQSNFGRKAFTQVFKVFLDERNYPIDFHCIAGQDRTGAVAFILNGLLGVSEEELYLDWESTGFWNRSANFNHAALFDKLVAGFEQYYPGGKTIHEKIELYVKSLGFTDADIAKFRGIMLEK